MPPVTDHSEPAYSLLMNKTSGNVSRGIKNSLFNANSYGLISSEIAFSNSTEHPLVDQLIKILILISYKRRDRKLKMFAIIIMSMISKVEIHNI